MAHEKSIYIKGARVHNLKNIEVEIPHEKLVVVTGLSGSGKSTLAFDTIFAEGQRRYVESLSAYARQFLGKISKPDVDIITGIAPAIAIEQKVNTRNPRSTVGTTTEIYDYLKLLYARIGHTFSPVSGQEVRCYSVDDVAAYIQQQGEGGRVVIAAPLTLGRGQGIIEKLTLLLSDGLMRVWTKGETRLIEDILPQVDEKTRAEEILVVIDRARIAADDDTQTRMRDSVARAFSYGEGICTVITDKGATEFSSRFEADGIQFEHPSEHLFSFNNPLGACPRCEGYGKVIGIDEDLVIPDKSKTIYEDAVACWRGETMRKWKEQLVENAYKFDFPIHTPFHELTQEQKRLLWRGNEYFHGLDDFFAYIDSERRKIQFRVMKARYTGKTTCPECGGSRLRREALYVKVGGKTVADLVVMPVDELIAFFAGLELDGHDTKTAARILVEIRNRLQYLADVGLGYLTLDRLSSTLSGGESQRINLSTSLGSNLTGSLYILDEPSIGLHPRDTNRLIKVLQQLRDLGNTVIVVEHDEDAIRAADYILDIGPYAGVHGGEIVAEGQLADILKAPRSLTGQFLSGKRRIEIPKLRHKPNPKMTMHLRGATGNNLKNVDLDIASGLFTCITGVSGSGKSTLINDTLYSLAANEINGASHKPAPYREVEGLDLFDKVVDIDQSPIGRTPRSNPATYTGLFTPLRELFAQVPESRARGYSPGRFSFNVRGGRCEACQGDGLIKVEMHFLPDVYVPCDVCHGKRYNRETLEITYKGHNISDILEMTVEDALKLFEPVPALARKLETLIDVGLSYIKLGQSATTLSGGEAQRVKLSKELSRRDTGRTLYILDEPTTGLHFHDIEHLLAVLHKLRDDGNTIVVIEHNLDVIKTADWVVDLGPEGGHRGGQILATGTPEQIAANPASHTGHFLSKLLPASKAAKGEKPAAVAKPAVLPQRKSVLKQAAKDAKAAAKDAKAKVKESSARKKAAK